MFMSPNNEMSHIIMLYDFSEFVWSLEFLPPIYGSWLNCPSPPPPNTKELFNNMLKMFFKETCQNPTSKWGFFVCFFIHKIGTLDKQIVAKYGGAATSCNLPERIL